MGGPLLLLPLLTLDTTTLESDRLGMEDGFFQLNKEMLLEVQLENLPYGSIIFVVCLAVIKSAVQVDIHLRVFLKRLPQEVKVTCIFLSMTFYSGLDRENN